MRLLRLALCTALFATSLPAAAGTASCGADPTPACLLEAAEAATMEVDADYARKDLLSRIAIAWVHLGMPEQGIGIVAAADPDRLDNFRATAVRIVASAGDPAAAEALVAEIGTGYIRENAALMVARIASGEPASGYTAPGPSEIERAAEASVAEAEALAEAGKTRAAVELLARAAAEVPVVPEMLAHCNEPPADLDALLTLAGGQVRLDLEGVTDTLDLAQGMLDQWWEHRSKCASLSLIEPDRSQARILDLRIRAGDIVTARAIAGNVHMTRLGEMLRDSAVAAAARGDMETARQAAVLLREAASAEPDPDLQAGALPLTVEALLAADDRDGAKTLLENAISAHRTTGGLPLRWSDGVALAHARLGDLDAAWATAMEDFHYQKEAPRRLLREMVAAGRAGEAYRDISGIAQPSPRAELLVALARAVAEARE